MVIVSDYKHIYIFVMGSSRVKSDWYTVRKNIKIERLLSECGWKLGVIEIREKS